jgi:hypothetical protein
LETAGRVGPRFLYLDVGSGYRWVLRSHGKRLADSEEAYVGIRYMVRKRVYPHGNCCREMRVFRSMLFALMGGLAVLGVAFVVRQRLP